MRTFTLERVNDESGVSGTGIVLEGTVFQDGKVVIRWLAGHVGAQSTAIYDSWHDFSRIHIDSHPTNGSLVQWYDCVPIEVHN